MSKTCTKCGIEKPLSEFGKNKQAKDGKTYWCLQCKREYNEWFRGTPTGIYNQIRANQRHYKHKDVVISKEDFLAWYEQEPKFCAYCDIPEDKIHILIEHFSARAIRLTVDCKDNATGYEKGNLVLACGLCNLLKNNFFSHDAFRKIAQEYIKPKWMEYVKSKVSEGKT